MRACFHDNPGWLFNACLHSQSPIAMQLGCSSSHANMLLPAVQMHRYRPVTGSAPCIQRLAASGALLVGKSNLHEIGVGMTGLNTRHGTARNPYDPRCYTGGSSSGSAAAVSSGLCPFALGEHACCMVSPSMLASKEWLSGFLKCP